MQINNFIMSCWKLIAFSTFLTVNFNCNFSLNLHGSITQVNCTCNSSQIGWEILTGRWHNNTNVLSWTGDNIFTELFFYDWNIKCYYIILCNTKIDSWVLFVMLLALEQKWLKFVVYDWNIKYYYIILHNIKGDSWVLFVILLTLEQKWYMLYLLHGFQNLVVRVKAAFLPCNPVIICVTCLIIHLRKFGAVFYWE